MALVKLKVQGSDGLEHNVLLDEISVGDTVLYALPGYKLNIGDVGVNDGFVSKHNPLPTFIESATAFGEVSVAQLTPVVQLQFPYGLSDELVSERSNNGSASIVANKLHVSTGAGANQSSQVLSVRVIKYSPGQGGLGRFTALFTTGVVGSTQYAGVGNNGDGLFFGFNGADFGILRRQGGVPEIRTLTVTVGSGHAENITITLDGDALATVAVTNTSDVTLTANEIAAADYSNVGKGWDTHTVGDKVIFESYDTAESKTGTYSIAGTSADGTYAQTLTAVAPTETFINQTDWNVDTVLDTTIAGNENKLNPSGKTLDPTKGVVYQVRYQWLGFGAIEFRTEEPASGRLVTVHIIPYDNTNTTPSLDNPTLPLCIMVANTTNATDIVVESASLSGFIEGKKADLELLRGESIAVASIGTTETPVISLHNHTIFQDKLNRVTAKIVSSDVSVDGTKPAIVRARLNATLTGASFSDHDTNNSTVRVDTSATAISGGKLIDAKAVAKSGTVELNFKELILHPKDTITISVEATSGSTDTVTGIDWEEDF